MAPETRYARSGDVHIAYQVVGDGPLDLVYVPTWISQVEHYWEEPRIARYFERLASFSRLIMFDRRGSGLSDPVLDAPTLEEQMDDVVAVMDAAGSERAAVYAQLEAGAMAALFAATHPERTSALVLYEAMPRMSWAPDYDWALRDEEREVAMHDAPWGDGARLDRARPAFSRRNPRFRAWFAKLERLAASPATAAKFMRMNARGRRAGGAADDPGADARAPSRATISSSTSATRATSPSTSRARGYVEPSGRGGDLVRRRTPRRCSTRSRSSSPARASVADDRADPRHRDVLGHRRLDSARRRARRPPLAGPARVDRPAVVVRELTRFRGRAVKTMGDGFLATFDGPARAIRCATAIRDTTLTQFGLEVRSGLHTGEIEVIGDDVGGIAVHIGARVGSPGRRRGGARLGHRQGSRGRLRDRVRGSRRDASCAGVPGTLAAVGRRRLTRAGCDHWQRPPAPAARGDEGRPMVRCRRRLRTRAAASTAAGHAGDRDRHRRPRRHRRCAGR